MTSETTPWASGTLAYAYDGARQRKSFSLSQPGGGSFTNGYAYDGTRRITNVTSQAGGFGYQYANAGVYAGYRIQKQTIPASTTNALYITNAFDLSGRMLSTTLISTSAGTLNSLTYEMNNAGQRYRLNRDTMEGGNLDHYTAYLYDAIGQLVSANATNLIGGAAQTLAQIGYKYDASWNLGQRTNNGTVTVFTNNVLNQVVKVGNSSTSHDSNGNMTTDSSGISYLCDDENQMTEAQVPSSWKTEFVYDGLRRLRVRKDYTYSAGWWPVGETRYIYDGMRVVQERDGSNAPKVSYTRGMDLSGSFEGAGGIGGLLARSAHSGSSPYAIISSAYYHSDGNGNVVYLVNPNHSLGAAYRYDPYGRTLASTGTLKDSNVYRFSSKEFMVSSGLYYYGYRFYSPIIQRWLNRDPLEETDGVNIYTACEEDLVHSIDSLGLFRVGVPIVAPVRPRFPPFWGFPGGPIQPGIPGGGIVPGGPPVFIDPDRTPPDPVVSRKPPPPSIPPGGPPKIKGGGSGPRRFLTRGYKEPGKKCWLCVYLCTGSGFSGVGIERYQPGGCLPSTEGYVPGWYPTHEGRSSCEEAAKCPSQSKMPYEGIYPSEIE